MTSVIKHGLLYGSGTYTGNTGTTTIQFPQLIRHAYAILVGNLSLTIYVISESSADIKNPVDGASMTVTANGNYNFTLSGLSWYTTPKFIGVL